MNEETTTPEAVELDTDIVKETLVDAENNNTELDIKTRFITRLRMTPLNVKVPLYVNGVLKSPETLAKLGLTAIITQPILIWHRVSESIRGIWTGSDWNILLRQTISLLRFKGMQHYQKRKSFSLHRK